MRSFFEMVRDIRETQGNNAKMDALKVAVDESENFKDFLYRVYCGNLTYNVKKFPSCGVGTKSLEELYDEYRELLSNLLHRKVTGNAALEECVRFAEKLTKEGQELFQKTLDRTLDFGLNVTNINKVVPYLLPVNSYMRCSGYDKNVIQKWFDSGDVVFAQEKMDGMFVVINPNTHSIRTRSGKCFNPDLFQAVWDDLTPQAQGLVLHGEIITFDENWKQNPREISNGVLNSTLKKETPLGNYKVFIWDVVDFTSEKGYKDPTSYLDRFHGISLVTKGNTIVPVDSRFVKSMEEIQDFYTQILSKGGEGLVIKNAKMPWENKTSKWQLKMKNEVDLDLKIVGYNPGEGKFTGMVGSIICESSDGLLQVSCSGMPDAKRKEITERSEELLDTIICVRANSIMRSDQENKPHSLFLPRFVELREDKTEADDWDRIQEMFGTF